MKVKITYKPEHEHASQATLAALREMYPAARVHETNKNDRVKALYLTVTNPENPRQHKKNG